MLGPDLTYLINLGYGDGSLGYAVTADSPANIPTPFGLFPDVSLSTVLSTLATDTEQGFQNLMSGTDPYAAALDPATSSATSFTDLLSALSADAAIPPRPSPTSSTHLECGLDSCIPPCCQPRTSSTHW